MLLKTTFNRRKLLGGAACLGASALTALAPAVLTRTAGAAEPTPKTKPIKGSWIGVLRNECRHHHYWNDACAKFSRRQWEQSVRDCADLGMEYLVLLATVTAVGDNAFFDTNLTHKAKELAYGDPIEAMLSAADDCGVKFFISTGFYGGWVNQNRLLDPTFARNRFRVMAQVAEKFAHHKSFYGWYLPDEPPIEGCFNEKYIEAVKLHAGEARRLVPRGKVLIAPYGTQSVVCDDKYVKQLERIDVDIIAYQDVVGQLAMTPQISARKFAQLRQAHDKTPQRALWADVEVFAWEGPPNTPQGALIPAPFERVKSQLEAVSPHVDVITIYQYQGLMSRPGSEAACGHRNAEILYRDYAAWLKRMFP